MHRIFRVKAYEAEHGPHFNEEHARKDDDYEHMLEREKEYEPYSEYGRGKAVRYVRY